MIRILALIAAITASVSATTQIRNTIPALVVLVQARFSGATLRLAPFFLLMCVSALALPVVCFSLWFNRGELRVSITLRIVSVIGATVLLGIFIADLRGRLPRFDLTGAASWLLHSALILLLIAFARHRSRDAKSDAPILPFLRRASTVAVIVWPIWLMVLFAQLALPATESLALRSIVRNGGIFIVFVVIARASRSSAE